MTAPETPHQCPVCKKPMKRAETDNHGPGWVFDCKCLDSPTETPLSEEMREHTVNERESIVELWAARAKRLEDEAQSLRWELESYKVRHQDEVNARVDAENDRDLARTRACGWHKELREAQSDRQREHELRVRYAGVVETQAERIRKRESLISRARDVCREYAKTIGQSFPYVGAYHMDRMLAIFGGKS